jgi:hypothetical protein
MALGEPVRATTLFGFSFWEETLSWIKVIFPGEENIHCDIPIVSVDWNTGKLKRSSQNLMPLESCLVARIFMHCISVKRTVALSFGRSGIGKGVKKWEDAIEEHLSTLRPKISTARGRFRSTTPR